jgi:hypothetical protein
LPSDHSPADEAGPASGCDEIEFAWRNACHIKRLLDDVINVFNMRPGGEFRHNTAICAVGGIFCPDYIRQDLACAGCRATDDCRRGIVATRFDA